MCSQLVPQVPNRFPIASDLRCHILLLEVLRLSPTVHEYPPKGTDCNISILRVPPNFDHNFFAKAQSKMPHHQERKIKNIELCRSLELINTNNTK